MKYKYTGHNRDRKYVTGIVEAENEMEAGLRLRSMQVRPQSISEKKDSIFDNLLPKGGKNKFPLLASKPINLKGLVVFTRQFSSLIDAGVPVVQALGVLGDQERRKAFKAIIVQIKNDLESGSGLAAAMERHPDAFSDLYVRIVEAGEISGSLDSALRRVGSQLERLGRLKAKVIGAMIYPSVTLVVAVVVLLFLLVKVIPEISKLYSEGNAELPIITQKVLALSGWVQNNFMILVGILFTVVFVLPFLVRVPAIKKVFDPFILKVPGFGDLIKKSSVARLTRTMATLFSSGVPLLTTFDICTRLIGNFAIKGAIEQARQSVIEGKSIALGLGEKNIFPPMVIHMISVGEMTGKLDDMLGKIADIYDDEVDDAVSAITGMIQPAMIIVVGIIIAFLLLAMYLPIFQLAEKVTGGA